MDWLPEKLQDCFKAFPMRVGESIIQMMVYERANMTTLLSLSLFAVRMQKHGGDM